MRKLALIIISFMILLNLQGCGKAAGNNKSSGSEGGNLKNEKVENYSVKIIYNGTEIKKYSIEDIKKMTTTNLEIDGGNEEGPSISYILNENNIKEYSKINFTGMWKDSLSMTKDEVEKGTVLDITNHGTVKLASKAIKKDKWIKDIAEIKVEK